MDSNSFTAEEFRGKDLKEASYYAKKSSESRKKRDKEVRNYIFSAIDCKSELGKNSERFYGHGAGMFIADLVYYDCYNYIVSNENEFKKLGFVINHAKKGESDINDYVDIYW